MKEALYYVKEDKGIRCNLCPNHCLIAENKGGVCTHRIRRGEELIAEGYGKVSALALDPIEKKPLYHFYPGTMIFSVGGLWCNLKCSFCQNWQIAHQERETVFVSPESLIENALARNSIGIAFTYNEPIIWYEYVLEAAEMARKSGLKVVLVTNGFINQEPLVKLLPLVDGMNIDVKAFNEDYYKRVCRGSLEPVKKTVETAVKYCHVEVTTLVIGGLNDSQEEMMGLFRWINRLNRGIPLHLSRYYPNYQMDWAPTPVDTLFTLRDTAREYLDYVYIGNVFGVDGNTYCPKCGLKLIAREGYVHIVGLEDSYCVQCHQHIPIIL